MKTKQNYLILSVVCVLIALALLAVASPFPVAYAQATNTPTPTNTPTSTNTPTPTNTPTNTPTPTTTTYPLPRVRFNGSVLCENVNFDCLQGRNGVGIHLYNSSNVNTFYANGSTGALTVSGALSANSLTLSTPIAAGSYVAPTAVPTATPQPTFAYTAPTAQPTYSFSVSDGTATVSPVNQMTFNGATLATSTPGVVDVEITGGVALNIFSALVSFSGTNHPSVTVYRNSFGDDPTPFREEAGIYRLTFDGNYWNNGNTPNALPMLVRNSSNQTGVVVKDETGTQLIVRYDFSGSDTLYIFVKNMSDTYTDFNGKLPVIILQ